MHQHVLPDNLWLKILIGMVLGVIVSITIDIPKEWMPWVSFPGDLFMALLKMIIVPLVLSSVILGVANAGSLKKLKQMGYKLIPYFIVTTAIAITIGMSFTWIIQPGFGVDLTNIAQNVEIKQTLENLTIPERLLNIIPINPAEAQLNKNMLQLVIFGIIIGIAFLTIKTKTTKVARDICEFTQDTCMMVVGWAMMIAPIAVFSLIVKSITTMGTSVLVGMGYYVVSVLGGLLSLLCVYLIIVAVIARRNPLQFLKDIRAAQIVAFSSSSSAATMPVSLGVAKERLMTDDDVSGFTIPLGATINMDGTALYQATAAIFLCQAFGIDLNMGELILLLITTIGASIGTPAMPGVGLIVLATILTSIGIPPEGIGIILGVDRLLDMCRTTINVTGDLTATVVMQRWIHGK